MVIDLTGITTPYGHAKLNQFPRQEETSQAHHLDSIPPLPSPTSHHSRSLTQYYQFALVTLADELVTQLQLTHQLELILLRQPHPHPQIFQQRRPLAICQLPYHQQQLPQAPRPNGALINYH